MHATLTTTTTKKKIARHQLNGPRLVSGNRANRDIHKIHPSVLTVIFSVNGVFACSPYQGGTQTQLFSLTGACKVLELCSALSRSSLSCKTKS